MKSEQEAGRFRMMEMCFPALENGTYTLAVKQTVNVGGAQPGGDTFQDTMNFCVQGAHFVLPPEEIEAVYPPAGATGNYTNSIGHITLKNKTLPWENNVHAAKNDAAVRPPWLALVTVTGNEAAASQVTVAELLQTQKKCPGIYYPLTAFPACTEKETDICCVLDLPRARFEEIFPRETELRYLAHVKMADLSEKRDDLIGMDGAFSVVVSNRFIPSGDGSVLKSTLHLVSLEGYGGMLPGGPDTGRLEGYASVRLVSLYHWDVYSQNSGGESFQDGFKNLLSGPMACKGHPVLERGAVPLPHTVRTGETTVSLYRGPLAPYRAGTFPAGETYTADGWILYDRQNGIFDLTYAAAWQLGRLLMLRNTAVAKELLYWRKTCAQRVRAARRRQLLAEKRRGFADGRDLSGFWTEQLCRLLAEEALIAPVSPDPKTEEKRDEQLEI